MSQWFIIWKKTIIFTLYINVFESNIIKWFYLKCFVFIRPVWIKDFPYFDFFFVCPKALVFELSRIQKIFLALVTGEAVLARIFDLHLLLEQYQLSVVSVCVIVFNVTNVLVMIHPPTWSYQSSRIIHFFHFVSEFLTVVDSSTTYTTQKFIRHL